MDIETQLQFINDEIGACDLRKTKLIAIRDTISGKIAATVASIGSLTIERDTLKTENDSLKLSNSQLEVAAGLKVEGDETITQ